MQDREEMLFEILETDIFEVEILLYKICKYLNVAEQIDTVRTRKLARKILNSLDDYRYFNDSLSGEIDYNLLLESVRNKNGSKLRLVKGNTYETDE